MIIAVNVETKDVQAEPLEEEVLEQMYRLIGCRLIEMVRLTKSIDIIVDEEGMYSKGDHPFVTELVDDATGRTLHLFGNIVFAGFDEDKCESRDLTDEEKEYITENIRMRSGRM